MLKIFATLTCKVNRKLLNLKNESHIISSSF